jgi:hypothetical protein
VALGEEDASHGAILRVFPRERHGRAVRRECYSRLSQPRTLP